MTAAATDKARPGKRKLEAGVAGTYQTEAGVKLKVPYAFRGSLMGREEIKAAEDVILHNETLTMGPHTTAFQKEFAEFCGVKHALTCSNCTTAMHVCTQIFGIGPGDEVIVTPNTFVATSLVVVKEGGRCVYADIDPRTLNIDPGEVKKKITKKTKAIYVVHFGGQMVEMDPIMDLARRHGLFVLEDCAHAPGAEYKGKKAGAIGHVGCFSFHSLKNMSTCEGGMITTNDDEIAKKAHNLRCMSMQEWHGQQDYWVPSHFDVVDVNGRLGNNYRMTDLQAAIGRVQLRKLPGFTRERIRIGRYLNKGIRGTPGVEGTYEAPHGKHVFHLYTILVDERTLGCTRDDYLRILYREEGIQGILHYQPTYHLTAWKRLGYDQGACPNAENYFYHGGMQLPMHLKLTKKDLDAMIAGVKNAARKCMERHKKV